MLETIEKAKKFIQAHPELKGLEVQAVGNGLHLTKAEDSFARLLPAAQPGQWHIEYCQNFKHWECIDFEGTMEECLGFLTEHPHYLFWEG